MQVMATMQVTYKMFFKILRTLVPMFGPANLLVCLQDAADG